MIVLGGAWPNTTIFLDYDSSEVRHGLCFANADSLVLRHILVDI